MPTPKRERYPAIPGAAHGTGPWGESHAPEGRVVMNDKGGGSFSAPMGDTPGEEAARFRQYANLHLRQQFPTEVRAYFSECRAKSVEADIAGAVLLAAVNGFAVQKGLDKALQQLSADVRPDYGVEYLAKAYVSGIGSLLANQVAQWFASRAPQVWQIASTVAIQAHQTGRVAANVGGQLDHEKLVKQAIKLQQAFGRVRLVEAFRDLPKSGAASDLSPEELERLNNKAARELSKMKMSGEERTLFLKSLWGDPTGTTLIQQIQELQAKIDGEGGRGTSERRWGKMFKRVLRMTRRAIRHSFRHRPTFVGAFRYPHRALIPAMDGRAWHAKLVGLGGTVLLDKSGSMSISEPMLQELLHRSPLATIACYSGGDSSQTDDQGMSTGHLTILAKEGRYAAERVWPAMPGGNVVDGPALRWLAKQARPRVWISDGGVTAAASGSSEQDASHDMRLECALLCRMAGITQYSDISVYLKSHHYMQQFR